MKNCIRELRQAQEMTQEQLSKRVDVSRQSIVAIEKGKYNPSLKLAFKIAKVFGKTIEDIFYFEDRDYE